MHTLGVEATFRNIWTNKMWAYAHLGTPSLNTTMWMQRGSSCGDNGGGMSSRGYCC